MRGVTLKNKVRKRKEIGKEERTDGLAEVKN
jgi:hypothetical protein